MKKLILIVFFASLAFAAFAQSSADERRRVENAVNAVKDSLAPDNRQAVFDIKVFNDQDGRLVVRGKLSDPGTASELTNALAATGTDYTEDIAIYPTDRWAQVRISAASLRTAGRHAAEMATQAVMGTPLRILEPAGEWFRVQCPDGYIAYVPSSSIVEKTADEMAKWRSARRFIVIDPYQIRAYKTPETTSVREVVSDLVLGSIVEAVDEHPVLDHGRIHVKLPDGRTGYVDSSSVSPIEEWASQPFDAQKILDTAYSMEGTPYLWGGTSTKALDCSGLAKVSYFSNGIILMRDASQQAKTGGRIEAKNWRSCLPGDLLFFGNSSGKVTHVAIYDHGGNYVHSSGRVKRNSVDPESPAYLTTPFLHAVRISGFQETPGITRARNHSWYF